MYRISKNRFNEFQYYSDDDVKRYKLKNKITATVLAISGIFAVGVGKAEYGDVLAVPAFIASSFDLCNTPSVTSQIKINDQLQSDLPTEIDKLETRAGRLLKKEPKKRNGIDLGDNYTSKSIDEYFDYFFKHYHDVVLISAERNGLHVFDSSKFVEALDETGNYEDMLDITNEYLEQLGVSLEFIHSNANREVINPGDVGIKEARKSLINTINVFSYIPKELIDQSGLKNIYLVKENLEHGPMSEPAGLAYPFRGAFFLKSYPHGVHVATVSHETGHLLDEANCGAIDMSFDGNFTRLNPVGFQYNGYNEQSDLENISRQNKGVVVSEYGATNPAEDKAELMEHMITGLDIKLLKSDKPVGEKYRFLLARLEDMVPGLVDFLFDISYNRTTKIPDLF